MRGHTLLHDRGRIVRTRRIALGLRTLCQQEFVTPTAAAVRTYLFTRAGAGRQPAGLKRRTGLRARRRSEQNGRSTAPLIAAFRSVEAHSRCAHKTKIDCPNQQTLRYSVTGNGIPGLMGVCARA